MNSAALGLLGERVVAMLGSSCDDLVINPSQEHDGAGWDFVVDFAIQAPRITGSLRQSFDTQPPSISCRIQVKTIWDDRNVVKGKLSSLSRLAGYPGPTFIYVLKMGADKQATSAFLIHMFGENLGALLKRLRQADSEGRTDLNKQHLYFTPEIAGLPIGLSGDALRQGIVDSVGGEHRLREYIATKERQRVSLGYEERAVTGSMIFKANIHELVDGFLSKQQLDVTEFQAVITRFGIPLPQFKEPIKDGKVTITPTTPMICELVIRPLDGSTAIRFDAECRTPPLPNLPLNHWRMLVICRLFQIEIAATRLSFSTRTKVLESEAHRLDEWLKYFQLLVVLTSSGARFELTNQERGDVLLGEASAKSLNVDKAAARAGLTLCEQIQKLMEYCAGDPSPLTLVDLMDAQNDISDVLTFSSDVVGKSFELKCSVSGGPIPGQPQLMNYFYIFSIGPCFVAYFIKSKAFFAVASDNGEVNSIIRICFEEFGYARVLRDLGRDYPRFRQRVEEETGVNANCEEWSARLGARPPIKSAA